MLWMYALDNALRPHGDYLGPQWGARGPFVCAHWSTHHFRLWLQMSRGIYVHWRREPDVETIQNQEVRPAVTQRYWHVLSLGLIIPIPQMWKHQGPGQCAAKGASHLIRSPGR